MSTLRLYDELAHYYHLLDPREEHADEAGVYGRALAEAVVGPGRSLLELGAGAGNNAWYLKADFDCTLTDRSQAMLDLSRAQNPECVHAQGDMRTLRLDRTFDAVLLHDAVVYMTTEADLRAVAQTAFAHVRPGGAALVAPDYVAECFAEVTAVYERDVDALSLRCLEWVWDPEPTDTAYTVEYALLIREGQTMRSVHETHVEGLFPRATWLRVLSGAGFQVEVIDRELEEEYPETDEIFLCRRPAE